MAIFVLFCDVFLCHDVWSVMCGYICVLYGEILFLCGDVCVLRASQICVLI